MLLVRLHVFVRIDDQFSTIDYVRYASDVILRLLEHELLHFAWNAPGRGRGDPVNFPQFRRRRNRLLDEWHEVFSQHCRVVVELYLFTSRKQAEQVRAGLHNEDIRLDLGEKILQLRNRVRFRGMAARHSVNIAQFLDRMRIRQRFNAQVTTMCLNMRIGFLFQPAQRICAACAIGENRFYPRIAPEFLVEPLAESAQRERIAEYQYREIARWLRRSWSALSAEIWSKTQAG